MRRNRFGEAYCVTADEIRQELESKGLAVSQVHLSGIDEPLGGDDAMFTGNIVENDDGEPVLYVDAPTREEVRTLIAEVGIEDLAL